MSERRDDPRIESILHAVALEPVERIPVVLEGSAWCARVSGMTLAEYCHDNLAVVRAAIDAFDAIDGADAMNYFGGPPRLMGLAWMSSIRLPGEQLGEDELWQIEEREVLRPEDYDRIVDEGWGPFYESYIAERLGPEFLEAVAAWERDLPAVLDTVGQADLPFLCGAGDAVNPYEYLCGGRSLQRFVYDLYRMPDKIEAAMRKMMEGSGEMAVEAAKQTGGLAVWVGGWRGASEVLSPALWERFVFPYHKQLVEEVAAAGLIPILHLDSDWTRDLRRFREYPANTCILSLDGRTDIRKAKEILGDHMCIMGDVPPALLSRGAPEDVYDHSRRLIADVGPTGYILQSGCDIPVDAPLENVQAMVNAAADAAAR